MPCFIGSHVFMVSTGEELGNARAMSASLQAILDSPWPLSMGQQEDA
jgi:hypothetical protein